MKKLIILVGILVISCDDQKRTACEDLIHQRRSLTYEPEILRQTDSLIVKVCNCKKDSLDYINE